MCPVKHKARILLVCNKADFAAHILNSICMLAVFLKIKEAIQFQHLRLPHLSHMFLAVK